jgi:hypothetical protein
MEISEENLLKFYGVTVLSKFLVFYESQFNL